jgi:salicylate hydroxylase
MAIEDAAVLSRLLGNLKGNNRKMLKHVFEAYDTVRRPRSQKLVTTSKEAGELYEFQIQDVLDDPWKVSANLQQRMKWIWYADLEKDVADALNIMDRMP